ncbi:MAG: hypothetical protein V4505_13235 [Pseudomonadota bacterium]
MSKTQRNESEAKPKPRQLKRMRQRNAMQHHQSQDYPQSDTVPPWKPLG